MAMVKHELDYNKCEEEERFHGLPPLKRFKILEKEKHLRHVQVCSLPAKKRVFAFRDLNFLEEDYEEDKENKKLYSNRNENFRGASEFRQVLEPGCNREGCIFTERGLESRNMAPNYRNPAEKTMHLKRKEGCMSEKASEGNVKKHYAAKRTELIDLNCPAPEACVVEEMIPALLNYRVPSSHDKSTLEHSSNKRPVPSSAVPESKKKSFNLKRGRQALSISEANASYKQKSPIEPKISASKQKVLANAKLSSTQEDVQRTQVSPYAGCTFTGSEARNPMAKKMSTTITDSKPKVIESHGLAQSEDVRPHITNENVQETHASSNAGCTFIGSESRDSMAEKITSTTIATTDSKQTVVENRDLAGYERPNPSIAKENVSPNLECTFTSSEARNSMTEKVAVSTTTITDSEVRTSTITVKKAWKSQTIASSAIVSNPKGSPAMVVEAVTCQNFAFTGFQAKASIAPVIQVEDCQKSVATCSNADPVNEIEIGSKTKDSVAELIEAMKCHNPDSAYLQAKPPIAMESEVQKSVTTGSNINLFNEAEKSQKLKAKLSVDKINVVEDSGKSLSISSKARTGKIEESENSSQGLTLSESKLLVAARKEISASERKLSVSKVNQTDNYKKPSSSTHGMAKFTTVKQIYQADCRKSTNVFGEVKPSVAQVNQSEKCKNFALEGSEHNMSMSKKDNTEACLKRMGNVMAEDSTGNSLKHDINDKSRKNAIGSKSEKHASVLQKSQHHGTNGKTQGHAKAKKCTPNGKCQGPDSVPNCVPAEKCAGHTESVEHVPSEKCQSSTGSDKHVPSVNCQGTSDKHVTNEKSQGHTESKKFVSIERCSSNTPNESTSAALHESADQISEVKEAIRADELEDDIEQEDDDGIFCDVCREADADPSDPIVFCDGCDVMVHASCYGYPLMDGIPSGDWFCRQCEWEKRKPKSGAGKARICCLCPSNKGVMKKTTGGAWAHLSCALFVPEVYYKKARDREGVEVGSVPSWRWDLPCSVCGGNQGTGACIQCTEIGCTSTFHVSCALDAGLTIDYRNGNTSTKTPAIVIAFCASHSGHLSSMERRHFKIVPRV